MNILKEKKVTAEDVQLMEAVSILSYSHVGAFLLPAYGKCLCYFVLCELLRMLRNHFFSGLILSMCNRVEPSIASRACKALCGVAFAGKEDDFFQLDEVRCIAEALLYTHSETLDVVSFKVSIFYTTLRNVLVYHC